MLLRLVVLEIRRRVLDESFLWLYEFLPGLTTVLGHVRESPHQDLYQNRRRNAKTL